MATVSRGLPEQPDLDVPKREARELLALWRQGDRDALDRVRRRHPRFKDIPEAESALLASSLKLNDAQLVIAREYGFSDWTALTQRIAAHSAAGILQQAISAGQRDAVVDILRAHPEMLHLPVSSGNWGPPMSHAANLGQLDIIKACAELGARDYQHWTPIAGSTLLHLAIDFREREIFDWLLAQGSDVNAPAAIDREGFGGHTPLFNTVICGPWPDATMAQALLEHGAVKDARANLRKFLDWTETPRWHEARAVTAAEWGRGFPEKNWVNTAALELVG